MRAAKPGFTIIEVILFLAITGVLFISMIGVIQSQDSQTQFSRAARDVESRLLDIANDVAIGYYPTPVGHTCELTNSATPRIDIRVDMSITDGTGSNQDCLFLGKVVQFSKDKSDINVHTIVGARISSSSGGLSQNWDELVPTTVYKPGIPPGGGVDSIEKSQLFNNMKIKDMRTDTGTELYGYAIVYDLGQVSPQTGGNVPTRLVGLNLDGSYGNNESSEVQQCVEQIGGYPAFSGGSQCWRSVERISLCVTYATNSTYTAKITLEGGINGSLQTNLEFVTC
jgi:hypothetical protein